MIRGFFTARSGLIAHQEHMNLISNNIANVNTVGFKSKRVSFTDLIYQNINRPTAENPAMIGHGVRINKSDLIMTQGPLQPTNRWLDFALTAPGVFFAVQSHLEEPVFTRAGSFIMSQDENGSWFLAAPNGDRILNSDFEPVEIQFEQVAQNILVEQERLGADGLPVMMPVLNPDGSQVVINGVPQYRIEMELAPWTLEPRLDASGNRIPILDSAGNQVVINGVPRYQMERIPTDVVYVDGPPFVDIDDIGIFRFDNPYGLHLIGNNYFAPSDNSGEPVLLEGNVRPIRANTLEGSNVELASEMVKVIEASRAFSFNSRMVQVADEVEQTVNSLR